MGQSAHQAARRGAEGGSAAPQNPRRSVLLSRAMRGTRGAARHGAAFAAALGGAQVRPSTRGQRNRQLHGRVPPTCQGVAP
jgi:hypothetical protein